MISIWTKLFRWKKAGLSVCQNLYLTQISLGSANLGFDDGKREIGQRKVMEFCFSSSDVGTSTGTVSWWELYRMRVKVRNKDAFCPAYEWKHS